MTPACASAGYRSLRRAARRHAPPLHVIALGTDPIRLSFLAALLRDAGIDSYLLDAQMSALEGGIGAFPRRLAVAPRDRFRAEGVLRDAGEPLPE